LNVVLYIKPFLKLQAATAAADEAAQATKSEEEAAELKAMQERLQSL
jgi:hypothetical protein